jgi:hypothetical protein
VAAGVLRVGYPQDSAGRPPEGAAQL